MGIPDVAREDDVYCSTGNTTMRGLGDVFITLSMAATMSAALRSRTAFSASMLGGTWTGTRITAALNGATEDVASAAAAGLLKPRKAAPAAKVPITVRRVTPIVSCLPRMRYRSSAA